MARRDKNRSSSGTFAGGVRQTRRITELSRSVSRRFDPMEAALSSSLFRPDLTAFDHEPVYAASLERDEPSPRQPSRGAMSPRRVPSSNDEPARKLLRPVKPVQTKKPVSPVVSHAPHSAKPRVEKARAGCKERPVNNRASRGGGSGKAFVPWCERKRR